MSEILEALKKLEREKSSRVPRAPDIAVEILKPDLSRPRKRFLMYMAIVFLSAIAAAGITYAIVVEMGWMVRSSPPSHLGPSRPAQQVGPVARESGIEPKVEPPPIEPLPGPARKAPPVPEVSRLPSKSSPPSRGKPIAPAPQGLPAPIEPAVPSKPAPPEIVDRPAPVVQTPPPPPSLLRDGRGETSQVPAKEPVPTTVPVGPAASSGETRTKTDALMGGGPVASPPSLKITVIVWDEDPSKRWTMINGMKAIEGSMIEGMKVVEITLTSVRFLHNGRHFEISMN